jgi:hypothetical protein
METRKSRIRQRLVPPTAATMRLGLGTGKRLGVDRRRIERGDEEEVACSLGWTVSVREDFPDEDHVSESALRTAGGF